jgi:hypothetical protein
MPWTKLDKVPKNSAMPDKVRWKFMFETARHAFSKIVFSTHAMQKLEKTRRSLPHRRNQNDHSEDAKRRSKPVSASTNLDRASQKAAIGT